MLNDHSEDHEEVFLVGITKNTEGRTCSYHATCGSFLLIDSQLSFKETTFQSEKAISVHCKLRRDARTCFVGWIAKEQILEIDWVNQKGFVKRFLGGSDCPNERAFHHSKNGAASISIKPL